jgi:hypothetical protein
MDPEAKRLAMDAISSVGTVFKQIGFVNTAAITALYLAKIREEDRARLGQQVASIHHIQELHQRTAHLTVQNFGAQNINWREK